MKNKIIYSQRIEGIRKPLYRFDAHLNGKNIAYLTTEKNKKLNYIWLKGLYVLKRHRNKKIATKLIKLALKKYKNKEIRLRARPYKDKFLKTKQLIKFYKKFWFKVYDKQNRMVLKA